MCRSTRHKLTWGVPVPWDEEHVFYVWFDALLNYYSALSYAPPAPFRSVSDGSLSQRRERCGGRCRKPRCPPRARGAAASQTLTEAFWPADVHLIAKDILRFHTVYWPALLMAAEIELPKRVFVHGYLLMDGEKMSKSLGNVLDPFEVIERFGADALRFYLLRDVPFGQDGSVSTASFEQRYESELANDYGNLASRSIAMIARYRDGVVTGGDPDELLARGLRRFARACGELARPRRADQRAR